MGIFFKFYNEDTKLVIATYEWGLGAHMIHHGNVDPHFQSMDLIRIVPITYDDVSEIIRRRNWELRNPECKSSMVDSYILDMFRRYVTLHPSDWRYMW